MLPAVRSAHRSGARALPAWLWLLLAGLVLISAGLYNGFPLVTSDSGTYINSALLYTVPDDRPVVYGLFIRATGLRVTLWLVIMVQGLLLADLLRRYAGLLAPRVTANGVGQLALVGLVAWGTGVSWFCSQIMPDIFTAIGLLALGLVLLGPDQRPAARAWLVAVLVLSGSMHSSNLLTFSLVALFVGVVGWRAQLFRRGLLSARRWRLATAGALVGWLLLPGVHAALGGGFEISRASSAFLMARLCETGILEKFLQKNCDPADRYSLCAYRDKLPNDAISFMWDPNSPLYQTGGWNANREEYQQIIRQIATSPRYYPFFVMEAIQATLRQLTHIGHGDGLTPYRENTNPYWKVQNFAGYELKEYLSSMQNRGQLSFTALNERVYACYALALLALGALLGTPVRRRLGAPAVLTVLVLAAGVVANAFVTGSLANVLDRLQARVAWVLPLAAVLLLAEHGPALLRRWAGAWLGSGLAAKSAQPSLVANFDRKAHPGGPLPEAPAGEGYL